MNLVKKEWIFLKGVDKNVYRVVKIFIFISPNNIDVY